MSRGTRALTLYQGIWEGIVEARPDLAKIDWIEVWGRNPKHDWSRVDPAKIDLVSLMKVLNWTASAADMSGTSRVPIPAAERSEAYWKRIIDGISVDGLQRFAAWAIKHAPTQQATIIPELTDDEAAMLATLAPQKQQAPAQWGSW